MRSYFFLLLIVSWPSFAQYNYGLTPVTYKTYIADVEKNSKKELIDLEIFIPNVVLDIRYATANNFTKEVIYEKSTRKKNKKQKKEEK